MQHISIRVPWHTGEWNGTVCQCPELNSFCKILPNIAESKNDEKEKTYAGKCWCDIHEEKMPACMGENGGFMNETPYTRIFRHPYSWNRNNPHYQLRPTAVEVKPYSFFGMPFKYMLTENQNDLDKKYPDLHPEEDPGWDHTPTWIYGKDRQIDVLDKFFKNVKANESLVLFYCKGGNPMDDDCVRLIVGLGEITNINEVGLFESNADFTYPYWDRQMEHSIRKDLKKSKGFLLPYQEYLRLDEKTIKEKTCKTKEEVLKEIELTLDKLNNSQKIHDEMSYACEHVSNHSMLIILEEARKCVEKVIEHGLVGGDWMKQVRWIDDQIRKVKQASGPFPAFAEALRAIKVDYAYLIEQDLRDNGFCDVKGNPWEAFEKLMKGEVQLPKVSYSKILPTYKTIWRTISKQEKEVLELLSRFEINEDSMTGWLNAPDDYDLLLHNPYLVAEEDTAVTTEMIDLGAFADAEIQGEYVPQKPSRVETELDERRIRSLVVQALTEALQEGDTLLSANELEEYVDENLKKQDLHLPRNFFVANKAFFEEKLAFVPSEKSFALQLKDYNEEEKYLTKIFKARSAKNVKSPTHEDWGKIVRTSIPNYNANNEISRTAIEDQQKALEKLADKRLSVLTGAAGTGKTSVVKAFLSSEAIQREGVLLLAPTGKARVRLGEMGNGVQALTIAQFLTRRGYFDWDTMKPYIPEKENKYSGKRNIIIDECSMLTIDDFYVLFHALDLGTINRIILIGDPYQLPPIGPGRPFADLCGYLKDEKSPSHDAYAKLTTVVRTINQGESDVLQLASWFSGDKPNKESDTIFDKIISGNFNHDLRVYTWKDESELKDKLHETLDKELKGDGELCDRIKKSIGLDNWDNAIANPDVLENFQILSPVKNPVWGTYQINNDIQEWLGDSTYFVNMGNDNIYVGDKVIQLVNEKHNGYPSKKEHQLSNGQIGFVKYANKKKNIAEVIFSGISGESFQYYGNHSVETEQKLDLAFAITVHKSQGSDFDKVLVVLPKGGRILSRELIYTALTRAKKRMIILIQDDIQWLMDLSKPQNSVVARRNSNMFEYSVRNEKLGIPYSENLIHKTLKDGLVVRSKSEVIIANMLIDQNIDFEEEKLIDENGIRCLPDFTFTDASGDTIIWEHLGMLSLPSYKHAWEKKLEKYRTLGYELGVNLFTTEDHEDGGIDSKEIEKVIEKIKEEL